MCTRFSSWRLWAPVGLSRNEIDYFTIRNFGPAPEGARLGGTGALPEGSSFRISSERAKANIASSSNSMDLYWLASSIPKRRRTRVLLCTTRILTLRESLIFRVAINAASHVHYLYLSL